MKQLSFGRENNRNSDSELLFIALFRMALFKPVSSIRKNSKDLHKKILLLQLNTKNSNERKTLSQLRLCHSYVLDFLCGISNLTQSPNDKNAAHSCMGPEYNSLNRNELSVSTDDFRRCDLDYRQIRRVTRNFRSSDELRSHPCYGL